MSTYVFKAMDVAGVKARGEVEADSKQAVADQLKSRGMIVLEIADKHASREIELSFMQRAKAQDLAVFSRQLATMITSGMSILRSLYVLEEQTENKFLKDTIVAVRKDVEAGLNLSDAMARHPKVFNPLFVAMTRAGEWPRNRADLYRNFGFCGTTRLWTSVAALLPQSTIAAADRGWLGWHLPGSPPQVLHR